MSLDHPTYTLILPGEVVGTFERESRAVAKIRTAPFHLDVPLEDPDLVHLGDKVQVKVHVTVESIAQRDKTSDDELFLASLP
jgi:hypothetical protein